MNAGTSAIAGLLLATTLTACERRLTERDVVDFEIRAFFPDPGTADLPEDWREFKVLNISAWVLTLCHHNRDGVTTCRFETRRRWKAIWETDAPMTDLTWSPWGPVWIDPVDGTIRGERLCDQDIETVPPCPDDAPLDSVLGLSAVDVSTSWEQVCALDDAGEVFCGQGYEPTLDFVPDRLRGGHVGYWTCALGDVGEVACWDGQGPVDLTWLPPDVVDVALAATPCALDEDGVVFCALAERAMYDDPFLDQAPVQIASGVSGIENTGIYLVMRRDEDWLSLGTYSYAEAVEPGATCDLDAGNASDCHVRVHEGDWEQFARPCALSPDGTLRCQDDWSMEE